MANQSCVERLTPLDLSMPRTYIRALLVFEQAGPTPQIIQALQSGLKRLSNQLPWLSGQVFSSVPTTEQSYSLEIRWEANTAPALLDKGTIAASYNLASSRNMPPDVVPSDVWPVPDMIDDTVFAAGAPVFASSIFRFPDQGIGLCVAIHHNVVDGAGFAEIIRLWAQNVARPDFTFRPSQSHSEQLPVALAAELQETSSVATEHLFERHPEYSRTPPAMPAELPLCTSKLFTISLHWIDTLKQLLRKYTTTPPSTNIVLCALLWSTITRVRIRSGSLRADESSRLATAVNGRQRIDHFSFSSPASPYFGNAAFYALTPSLPAQELASSDETPISSLAEICNSIAHSQSPSTLNSRHIAEVYDLVTRLDDPRRLFVGWDLFNSRDVTITSWAGFDLYGVEFAAGLGRAAFVRVPCMEADGVVLVLPRRRRVQGKGEGEVADVMVMLRKDHMNALEDDSMWQTLTS